MKQPPSASKLCEKIEEILRENIEVQGELTHDAALMKELGLDSLDMIELSFSLEEFFGFEFASKDAFEALDEATNGAILAAGQFTDLGRKVVLQRAPELAEMGLPESLGPLGLQQYYSVATFARLIREFYLAAPDRCPRTGEDVIEKEFRLISANTSEPVGTLTGDDILEAWVQDMATNLPGSAA